LQPTVTRTNAGYMKLKDIHAYLIERAEQFCPELLEHLHAHGPMFIPRRLSESLFLFLARMEAAKTLSAELTDSIWARLLRLSEQGGEARADAFDREFDSGGFAPKLTQEQRDVLRHLRQLFLDGLIDEQRLHQGDYQMVRKVVSGLWGYADWSADMTAIFYFGLPDIWCEGDSSLQSGLRQILHDDHHENMEEIIAAFSPFRTYLALHIWRFLDPHPQNESA